MNVQNYKPYHITDQSIELEVNILWKHTLKSNVKIQRKHRITSICELRLIIQNKNKLNTQKSRKTYLYWLKSELMAEIAASLISGGAGKSGKPSARLIALHLWARRDSC